MPIPYFDLVFTLPDDLNPLIQQRTEIANSQWPIAEGRARRTQRIQRQKDGRQEEGKAEGIVRRTAGLERSRV